MTDLQRNIYRDALQRSRKTIIETAGEGSSDPSLGKQAKKTRAPATRPKDKQFAENSANVLMDLRKAASHPMLFRTRFTDETLSGMTRQLLKEPDFKKRGAMFDLVKEDMSVMTDSELQVFCASYKVGSTSSLHPARPLIPYSVHKEVPPGSILLRRRREGPDLVKVA